MHTLHKSYMFVIFEFGYLVLFVFDFTSIFFKYALDFKETHNHP